MSVENKWGELLKAFRQRTGISQNRLIDEISQLLRDLDPDEVVQLEKIGIFQDLEKLTSLDNPASLLNRYENIKNRKPKNRKRHLSLLWGLQRLGGINSIEEANTFLQLAESSNLIHDEIIVLFGAEDTTHPVQSTASNDLAHRRYNLPYVTTRIKEPRVSSLSENDLVNGSSERPDSVSKGRNMPKQVKLFLLAGGSTFLLIVAIIMIVTFISNNQINDPLPIITDEFNDSSLDANQWHSLENTFVFVNDGELVFDLPLNSEDTWKEEALHHTITDNSYYLSRIKFRARLDTPLTYESGYIGVQTNCVDQQGFLTVYLGGTVRRLRAEYAFEDDVENGESVDLGELVTGKSYDIEMVWRSGGLYVYIDQELRHDTPIPCPSPLAPYFNINAGVGQNQALIGAVEQVSVWK